MARAVEHMDRRIGDLFRHAEALDQLGIGHEQRRLGVHVTNRGALLAAGLGCPVVRYWSSSIRLLHQEKRGTEALRFLSRGNFVI